MDNANKLLKMKDEINEAKTAISRIEGEEAGLLKQLEQFGCKTLEEAQAKLSTMEADNEKLEAQINKEIQKLEGAHEWTTL